MIKAANLYIRKVYVTEHQYPYIEGESQAVPFSLYSIINSWYKTVFPRYAKLASTFRLV